MKFNTRVRKLTKFSQCQLRDNQEHLASQAWNLGTCKMGKHFVSDRHICTSFVAVPMQLEKVGKCNFLLVNSGILYMI